MEIYGITHYQFSAAINSTGFLLSQKGKLMPMLFNRFLAAAIYMQLNLLSNPDQI